MDNTKLVKKAFIIAKDLHEAGFKNWCSVVYNFLSKYDFVDYWDKPTWNPTDITHRVHKFDDISFVSKYSHVQVTTNIHYITEGQGNEDNLQ